MAASDAARQEPKVASIAASISQSCALSLSLSLSLSRGGTLCCKYIFGRRRESAQSGRGPRRSTWGARLGCAWVVCAVCVASRRAQQVFTAAYSRRPRARRVRPRGSPSPPRGARPGSSRTARRRSHRRRSLRHSVPSQSPRLSNLESLSLSRPRVSLSLSLSLKCRRF